MRSPCQAKTKPTFFLQRWQDAAPTAASAARRGRIVHAIQALPDEKRFGISHYAKSLCGKTHDARSAGWSNHLSAHARYWYPDEF